VGPRQPVDVAKRDALAGARRAEHAEDLALADLQVDARQDFLPRKALPDILELDDRLGIGGRPRAGARGLGRGGGSGSRAHRARKGFVRKKSEISTQIEASTTVRVVAMPPAEAPPSTFSPFQQPMTAISKPKKTVLERPLMMSEIASWFQMLPR